MGLAPPALGAVTDSKRVRKKPPSCAQTHPEMVGPVLCGEGVTLLQKCDLVRECAAFHIRCSSASCFCDACAYNWRRMPAAARAAGRVGGPPSGMCHFGRVSLHGRGPGGWRP